MKELRSGYIDVEKILSHVSEEEIFGLVFEKVPQEFEYLCSPFREDNHPGCWFSRDLTGRLRFCDFGNPEVQDGIKMFNIDCFDAVRIFYKLSNFYQTLEFIYNSLIKGRKISEDTRGYKFGSIRTKNPFYFTFEVRDFDNRDKRYWSPYGISKDNLIKDKVFPVSRYKMFNTKSGDLIVRPTTVCYVFTEFKSGHKKLYLPLNKGRRFITDCDENDLGGFDSLDEFGETLVITKSYKDWRVLLNIGLLNVVWTQNEGMYPSNNFLIALCKRFKDIIVLYDNDETGINSAKRLVELINVLVPNNKARFIHLPTNFSEVGVKDPADAVKLLGPKNLKTFLHEHIKHP